MPSPIPSSITWVHAGDLHMDEADGMVSRERLAALVGEINAEIGGEAAFLFLPGDNASHATAEQYRAIAQALAPLAIPYRTIPGDHDFEEGDLAAYEAIFPEAARPECEVFAGHRCIFLDIVSAGAGGPDFRLTMHDRNRLLAELAAAQAEEQPALVFMHAYPGDLAADADWTARVLAEGGVLFVDTGHTHYNELLNDGRVVYGATRSTAQIEEGGGRPGFSLVTVHDRVPNWRFKELGGAWPFVQIVAPCDLRLVTRPADPRQVPRPGQVAVVAKLFGAIAEAPVLFLDGAPVGPMRNLPGTALWSAEVALDAGLHEAAVACGGDRDAVRILVRGKDAIPRRGLAVAPGCDIHAVGAWPERGIKGSQLGPNRNGMKW